jgi:urease accessory protein
MDGSATAAPDPNARQWNARLEIGLAVRGRNTVAVHRRHTGPLRLQKALYPEGPDVAHLLIVHPPAGIAGGDRLEIDIDVAAHANALVTTPGATKWYRSDGVHATQDVALTVARGASLEWLPQENIVFDGADANLSTTIACESGATCIGWDIVALGRHAAGERFTHGALRQDLALTCDGRVVWRDRARIAGSDPLLRSPVGWNGHHVAGTFWAWGAAWAEAERERARHLTMAHPSAGVTMLRDGLVVARALSDSVESIRALFQELWAIARPAVTGRCATMPRIWST